MGVRLRHQKTASVCLHESVVLGGSGGADEEELLLPTLLVVHESLQTYSVLEDARIGNDRKDITYTVWFDKTSSEFWCVCVAYYNSEELFVGKYLPLPLRIRLAVSRQSTS